MKLGLDKTVGGYQIKDWLGTLGLVGDAYALITLISGRFAMIVGFLSLLFIFLWGLSSRASARPFVRNLASLAVVVSSAALALALLAGVAYLTTQEPDPLGATQATHSEDFVLTSRRSPSQAFGSYRLKFTREADIAEVGLTPAPEDAGRVARIDVTNVAGLPEEIDSVAEMYDKRSPTQIYYEVVKPSQNFTVTLDVLAHLDEAGPVAAVRMRAHYKYARRDQTWRLRRWFFDNIAERLR